MKTSFRALVGVLPKGSAARCKIPQRPCGKDVACIGIQFTKKSEVHIYSFQSLLSLVLGRKPPAALKHVAEMENCSSKDRARR